MCLVLLIVFLFFFVSLCVWENLFERLGKNFKKPAIIIFAN